MDITSKNLLIQLYATIIGLWISILDELLKLVDLFNNCDIHSSDLDIILQQLKVLYFYSLGQFYEKYHSHTIIYVRYLPTMVQYCYYKLPYKHHNKKYYLLTILLLYIILCFVVTFLFIFRFEQNSSSANGFRNDITY